MHLPVLKNTAPASLDGMSLEDYIRNATHNLRNVAAALPGSGSGVTGAVYLGFNGNTGKWTLNKETVDPKSLGRILVPEHGMYEGMIEWANGLPLQKCNRPLRGVTHTEPMTEALLKKPLSPGAYRQDTDGPKYMMGFAGLFFDDGTTVIFDHSSGGATKAINALSTTALQAVVAFGEMVFLLRVSSWMSGTSPQRTSPKRSAVRLNARTACYAAARCTRRAVLTTHHWF
jgi:hypothetical protein